MDARSIRVPEDRIRGSYAAALSLIQSAEAPEAEPATDGKPAAVARFISPVAPAAGSAGAEAHAGQPRIGVARGRRRAASAGAPRRPLRGAAGACGGHDGRRAVRRAARLPRPRRAQPQGHAARRGPRPLPHARARQGAGLDLRGGRPHGGDAGGVAGRRTARARRHSAGQHVRRALLAGAPAGRCGQGRRGGRSRRRGRPRLHRRDGASRAGGAIGDGPGARRLRQRGLLGRGGRISRSRLRSARRQAQGKRRRAVQGAARGRRQPHREVAIDAARAHAGEPRLRSRARTRSWSLAASSSPSSATAIPAPARPASSR